MEILNKHSLKIYYLKLYPSIILLPLNLRTKKEQNKVLLTKKYYKNKRSNLE